MTGDVIAGDDGLEGVVTGHGWRVRQDGLREVVICYQVPGEPAVRMLAYDAGPGEVGAGTTPPTRDPQAAEFPGYLEVRVGGASL